MAFVRPVRSGSSGSRSRGSWILLLAAAGLAAFMLWHGRMPRPALPAAREEALPAAAGGTSEGAGLTADAGVPEEDVTDGGPSVEEQERLMTAADVAAEEAQQAQQQQPEAGPDEWEGHQQKWDAVPVHRPDWAKQCAQPPCSHMWAELTDGPADEQVAVASRYGEDRWLRSQLFHGKAHGLSLEFGCVEAEACVTRWLAKAAGWHSVLMDGDKAKYDALVASQPDAIIVNAAVCSDFRTLMLGGTDVECLPMQFVLDKLGLDALDLLVLDTGGGSELELLRGLRLDRMPIRAIVMGADGSDRATRDEAAALLAAAGFQAVPNKGVSGEMAARYDVFVHQDAWEALAHAPDVAEVAL